MVAVLVALVEVAGLVACAAPPSGQPRMSPPELVFPDTAVGRTATEDLVITNTATSGALTVESTALSGPDATMFAVWFDDGRAVVLQPGQSATVPVVFVPGAPGPRSATLHANHSGGDDLRVPLSGTAVEPGPGATPLDASPAAVDMATTTVGDSISGHVVLSNPAASGSITVDSTQIVGPDATMFADDHTDGAPVTLGPGRSVTVTVTFSPTAPGSRSARLVVTHTGTNPALSVPLSGEADPSGDDIVIHRVNTGGPRVPASPSWTEDSATAPSGFGNGAASGNAVASWDMPVDLSHPSVPPGTPVEIFRSERHDPPAAPDLAYSLPVPDGTPVELRLYLAEMFAPAQEVGGRVFDVNVDGAVALRDVDVFALAGAGRALVLSVPVVSDGAVDVRFVSGVQNASVKAIEVVTQPVYLAARASTVTVGAAGLNSSTYTSGSFRVTNDSAGGQRIARVRFDLTGAVLSDLVFDPDGAGGDTLGKGFTVDDGSGVGAVRHGFDGPHDGGYDVLEATFSDFAPGETVAFSVDIDPTSIRGSSPPGPGEAGSVSGLELAGAQVTVTYDDGIAHTGRLYRAPGSLGQSQVRLTGVERAAPTIAVVGVPSTPASVTGAAQTVRVTGPAGASVRLLQVEGALFVGGLPGGGFDIDPFEANSAVAVREQMATIGPAGTVDVAVTLTASVDGGGSNRFVAVVADASGTGPTSNLAVLQLA